MASVSLFESVKSLEPDEASRVKMLLERGVKIPPQPRVIEELRKLILRGELDVRIMARLINQDPAITALLFKVVTSAAYRKLQPFDSVESILHSLGVKETYNIVQAISLATSGDVKKNRQAYEAFWSRSQDVARLAMLIADERIAVCNIFPDQAYLAGVFHDCGVLLLMQRFPTYCAEMQIGMPGVWTDLLQEDKKFNAEHPVVGYLVARHWHLPEFICDAIRYHHDIRTMGLHASRTMVAILQLAIEIYNREQRIDNPEWGPIKDEVLPEVGLNEEALPEFIDIIVERFQSDE